MSLLLALTGKVGVGLGASGCLGTMGTVSPHLVGDNHCFSQFLPEQCSRSGL